MIAGRLDIEDLAQELLAVLDEEISLLVLRHCHLKKLADSILQGSDSEIIKIEKSIKF